MSNADAPLCNDAYSEGVAPLPKPVDIYTDHSHLHLQFLAPGAGRLQKDFDSFREEAEPNPGVSLFSKRSSEAEVCNRGMISQPDKTIVGVFIFSDLREFNAKVKS